jgi:hypothetical protein
MFDYRKSSDSRSGSDIVPWPKPYCSEEFGPEPRQADSPTAGLSDYRNSAPSPMKPDSPRQPINYTNKCPWGESCGSAVALLCSGVDFVAQQPGPENKILVMGPYFWGRTIPVLWLYVRAKIITCENVHHIRGRDNRQSKGHTIV